MSDDSLDGTPAADAWKLDPGIFGPLLARFYQALNSTPGRQPDLHLVIVEAPYLNHPKLHRQPPLEAVRPDLASKPMLTRWPEVITTLPTQRFIFFGDESWLDPFLDIAREAGQALRSSIPEIDRFVSGATWEGPQFYMPNLWSWAIPRVYAMTTARDMVQRWRWGDDLTTRMVPFEDDDLQSWVEANRSRGIELRNLPSQEVSVTTFTQNAYAASGACLLFLVREFGTFRKPADSGSMPGADPDPVYVTLDQMASMVHRTKRTLERCVQKGSMPPPEIEGGGGKAAYWEWRKIRPWLEQEYGMKLAERFPGQIPG